MPYQLQSSKGGMRAEKVYTMSIDTPLSQQEKDRLRGNARRAPRSYNGASTPGKSGERMAAPQSGRGSSAGSAAARRRHGGRQLTALQERELKRRTRAQRRQKILSLIMPKDSEPKIRTVRASHRPAMPVSILFACAVCTALFMFIIYNSIQLSDQRNVVSELKDQLTEQKIELKDLKVQLEQKNDLLAIERRAKELGMVRMDELSKYYVTITPEDKIESLTDD